MKNQNCDNNKCGTPNGQVRRLPTGGDGGIIVCHACYAHEMEFRCGEIAQGRDYDLPCWEMLPIYGND